MAWQPPPSPSTCGTAWCRRPASAWVPCHTSPGRAAEAEQALRGKKLDEAAAAAAAQIAFKDARPRGGNAYLPDLGRRTLVRALMQAQAMEA